MSNQTAPTPSKVDILEEASSIVYKKDSSVGVFMIGNVGDVVLTINVIKGEFDWTDPDNEVEYHSCVRGTIQYQFRYGDQDLPPIDLNQGEFLTIPAGLSFRGTCSDDVVGLVLERVKPWHVIA